MAKIAFLFSGQGSQYVGMGKEFYTNFEVSRKIFEQADEALGLEISEICFEDKNNLIGKTEFTQPAILTTSVAILEVLKEKGIFADVVAGLSLGEYTALVSSGVLNFEEAVRLVRKRGKFMQEAVPEGVGTMAAILGLERDMVLKICEESNIYGIVEAANFNCPGQIVIAGEVEAVRIACKRAEEMGAKRAIMLSVSGPFHTSMLSEAAEKLSEELKDIKLNELQTPYITNVTGEYVSSQDEIKDFLKQQVMSSVYWEDTIKRMIEDGVDTFIEIGPGKTLSGFIKKVDRKKKIMNVENIKTLEKVLSHFTV